MLRKIGYMFGTLVRDYRDGYALALQNKTLPAPGISAMDAEILNFLRINERVGAIKYLRSQTGLPLKEAMEYVKNLEQKHGLNHAS